MHAGGGRDIGYVVNRDGLAIRDIKKGFAAAAMDAGFKEPLCNAEKKPRLDAKQRPLYRATISPRVMCHTAGTWMAQRGVPLWEISGYLGQSHECTTELYGHHHPDHLAKAPEAFD